MISMSLICHPTNRASIILFRRYGNNLIHTYAGPSMITINPCHPLAIYSEKIVQMFKGCKLEDMPPHIYSAGQMAYRTLMSTKKDQSIAFIGRSGSGKSTNFRHVLSYLTQVAGSVNKTSFLCLTCDGVASRKNGRKKQYDAYDDCSCTSRR